MKEHLSEYIARDMLRWEHADLDKDAQLNEEEYAMFLSPKKYAHMIYIVAKVNFISRISFTLLP